MTTVSKDWEVFKEVAMVIGEQSAMRELSRLSESELRDIEPDDDLGCAFTWCETPQGIDFWNSIHDEDVPKGFTPLPERGETPTDEAPDVGTLFKITADLSDTKALKVFEDRTLRVLGYSKDKDGKDILTFQCEGSGTVGALLYRPEWVATEQQLAVNQKRDDLLKQWKAQGLEFAHDTVNSPVKLGAVLDFIAKNY